MRCRKLDIFKILGIFWEFFRFFLDFFFKCFGNFSEGFFLEEFFWSNFLGEIFWKDFLGGFFGRIFFGRIFLGGLFLEEIFGRNSLFYFNVEGIDLFVKILVFVKILSESTRKEYKI